MRHLCIKCGRSIGSAAYRTMVSPISLLVLSCGRPALLNTTLTSLFAIVPASTFKELLMLDCRNEIARPQFRRVPACNISDRERDIMCNVDRLYLNAKTTFVLFIEDDWKFTNPLLFNHLRAMTSLLWHTPSATTIQLTGKNVPIHYNKTRGIFSYRNISWAWTNSPAGPGGMFGSWTNNPHIGRSAIRPADLTHEAMSSLKYHRAGYGNIQTMMSYVVHIGGGAHIFSK